MAQLTQDRPTSRPLSMWPVGLALASILVEGAGACHRSPTPPTGEHHPPDAGPAAANPLAFVPGAYPVPEPATPGISAAIRTALGAQASIPSKTQAERALRTSLAGLPLGRTRALLDVLGDPSIPQSTRLLALRGLGWFPDRAAIPQLAKICVQGQSPALAVAAADALAATGDPGAVPPLEALGARKNFPRGRWAGKALAALITQGAPGTDSDPRRAKALSALRRLAGSPDARIRESALASLAKVGSHDDLPWLVAHTRDTDGLVRRWAIEGVATHGKLTHVDLLAHALKDPIDPVASAAAKGLARLKDRRAVPGLVKYLQGSHRGALGAVVHALVAIGDGAAAPALVAFLEDKDGYIRATVAHALGQLGNPTAIPALRKALGSEGINARTAVAQALGSLGPSGVVALDDLRRVAENDPHPQVREAATKAIRNLQGPQGPPGSGVIP